MTMPARIALAWVKAGTLVLRRATRADWDLGAGVEAGQWAGANYRGARARADHLDDIVARLADFLRSGSPGPRWVLSLFELHTSIYGEHLGEQTVLRVQDRDAASFAIRGA